MEDVILVQIKIGQKYVVFCNLYASTIDNKEEQINFINLIKEKWSPLKVKVYC